MNPWLETLFQVARARELKPGSDVRGPLLDQAARTSGPIPEAEFGAFPPGVRSYVLLELAFANPRRPDNIPALARGILQDPQARIYWMEAVIALLECGDESGISTIQLAVGDSAHPLPRYEWQDSINAWMLRETPCSQKHGERLYRLLDF